MALYGPLLDRYGRDKGQYKHKEYHVTPEGGLLTGPQLVLALAERGKKWQWGPGGLVFLNSHFRAALQKTLNMHRQRHKEYTDVIQRLTEYRSHVDQRRRDHGYESEHG